MTISPDRPVENQDRNCVTENPGEKFITEKKIKRLTESKPIATDKYHLASRYLRKMMELKKKKSLPELEKVQQEVLSIFENKRIFGFYAYKTERVIYRLFDNKQKKPDESQYTKKIKVSHKEEICKHSISKHNANVFPTAQFGKYYYLCCPISQLHADYINSHPRVSKSTIYRNLDKSVKPMKKTPHIQCSH